ncbi:LamG-like jellyroll fold domain-containing protein [Pedobacter psychrodurus]|uniref:LamG-like jellyroll fold domain-containing protein n=1 Tax=Pedobacter psychrodurus TaxID=2530456 RepID=UPI00292F3502|nr:LamG-like jellyroll fold domain-containing protein [Pedobacter psychrodurus]
MKISNKFKYYTVFALFIPLCFSACKKYANPQAVYEDLNRSTTKQRKVLIIGIDGLGGSELQAIAPLNFTAMQKNGKYSLSTNKGISDAAGWVSLLTGTGFVKHQILNDNFERYQDPNSDDHGTITSYRNVLDYITQFKTVKTGVVTPWASLRKYLSNSDFAPTVNTDIAVKDSTIAILKNQASLGTLIVNFRDVEAAGANGGFTANNAAYKASVTTTDGYLGEILATLKARKTYANEDWLVILTTNHGGSSAAPTSGFMLAYNPSLTQLELKKSGFNTISFKTSAITAIVPNDNGFYNMSDNKDFTVQMQTKFNTSNNYPQFLGKSTLLNSTTMTGWFWMQEGNTWNLEFGGSANGGGGKQQLQMSGVLANGWHTLTMTVKYVNSSTRTASAYVDGVFKNSYNVSASKNINTTEPLKIGAFGGESDFYAANLTVFNTALDATTIANNISLKDITQHPNYTNLIGFWAIDEGAEGLLGNKAPTGYNMVLGGQYKWTSLGTDVPSGTIADPNYVVGAKSYVSTLGDAAALALYWMNIKILNEYGIDGNPFLNQYELEFLK